MTNQRCDMRCTAAGDGESLLALHGGRTVYMVTYTVLEYIIQKPHSINNTQKKNEYKLS